MLRDTHSTSSHPTKPFQDKSTPTDTLPPYQKSAFAEILLHPTSEKYFKSQADTEYLQAPRLQKLGSMLELAPLALKWLDHPRHSFQHCDLFVLEASRTWRLHILPWWRSLSWTHPAAWSLYEISGSWMLRLYIGAITNSHLWISNRVGEAFWLNEPPRERERKAPQVLHEMTDWACHLL